MTAARAARRPPGDDLVHDANREGEFAEYRARHGGREWPRAGCATPEHASQRFSWVNLYRARVAKGMTPREVSQAIGARGVEFSAFELRCAEAGEFQPDLHAVLALVEVLGITAADLVECRSCVVGNVRPDPPELQITARGLGEHRAETYTVEQMVHVTGLPRAVVERIDADKIADRTLAELAAYMVPLCDSESTALHTLLEFAHVTNPDLVLSLTEAEAESAARRLNDQAVAS